LLYLAEPVDVGKTHSTIQDTPIGTTSVDAIALNPPLLPLDGKMREEGKSPLAIL
jgi:hypothetical protein